jgi:hypothetical protein
VQEVYDEVLYSEEVQRKNNFVIFYLVYHTNEGEHLEYNGDFNVGSD